MADGRTAGLLRLNHLVQGLFAQGEVPTLGFQADGLMSIQVSQLDDLLAGGVGAHDVELLVDFEEGPAADGADLAVAAVGAFGGVAFGAPVGDAVFAEEFAAGIALHGIHGNLTADDAVELVEAEGGEPLLVVARAIHFCCLNYL